MGQSTFKISGVAGELRTGSRHAAALGAWEARHLEDARWRLTFEAFTPDPYWFEAGSTFTVVLAMGRGHQIKRPCEIVSVDPLILDLEIPV